MIMPMLMATFLLNSGGPHLLAILQNLSPVNMLRSEIKHEYALWVPGFVFLTSPFQMKQSGPGKDKPLTWRFPHHPMAQSLKSKFLLCDLPSSQNSLCVYWHMTKKKTQIFSSLLLEGGISLQCICVFKAEAGNNTSNFNRAPWTHGEKVHPSCRSTPTFLQP